HGRAAADHVEHRYRLRNHAAHRRADDRRHDLLDAADADRDPGDFRTGEGHWVEEHGRFRRLPTADRLCCRTTKSSRACRMIKLDKELTGPTFFPLDVEAVTKSGGPSN